MQHPSNAPSRYYEKKTKKFRGSQAVNKEPQGHNLKLLLEILELIKKSQKNVLSSFNSSLLRNLVEGAIDFLISLKEAFKSIRELWCRGIRDFFYIKTNNVFNVQGY